MKYSPIKVLASLLLIIGIGILIMLIRQSSAQQTQPQVIEKIVYVTPIPNTSSPASQPQLQPPIDNSVAKKLSNNEWQVIVSAKAEDIDTGIPISDGQSISIKAQGRVTGSVDPKDAASRWVGPNGWGSDTTFNNGRKRPLPPGSSFMALCYRIGNGNLPVDDEQWGFAGALGNFTAKSSGTLHFTVNDAVRDENGNYWSAWRADNDGQFTVRVRVE